MYCNIYRPSLPVVLVRKNYLTLLRLCSNVRNENISDDINVSADINVSDDINVSADFKQKEKNKGLLIKQKKKEKTTAQERQRIKNQQKRAENDLKLKEVYSIPTEPGEKKDVSGPLPSTYSPQYTEAAWYQWWEKQGFFNPDFKNTVGDREKFVLCLPPPNVTGSLHLGHALGNSIQDAIVRWRRMKGDEVLWNPGCDHAGIATQVLVEKQLWREQGKTRHDLGRDKFIQEVWKWKHQKGDEIYDQMKRLGSSLDWSRAVFTLDPKLCRAVNEAFIRLHEEGLFYRKKRMVNWSCALTSAISDIEVDNHEVEGRTFLKVPGHTEKVPFGVMTYFAYQLEDGENEVVVATTRPETMLGDTAIAVHPEDTRYRHLHGKCVIHPLAGGRRMPIICDEYVQQDLGTGAVKLTPSHDPNDCELGHRHQLDFIDILDDSGCMVNVAQPFMGLKRFEARRKVVEALKAKGLYRQEQDHAMTLPICSRSNDVIEPRLKYQWFVNCADMAEQAIQAVKSGDLKLIPSHYERQWFDWLEKSKDRDWCISRQLWWGHRVPAYRIMQKNGTSSSGESVWISAHSKEEAIKKAAEHPGMNLADIEVTQDEDVLDTWFSSALFPFSIFGWPEQTAELNRFYPTQLLETASDIMFFWVARMVMMGQKLTGTLPFKEVLFHSILTDAHSRKMSKSLGNVIDPMDVIHGISLQELHSGLGQSNLDPSEVKRACEGQTRDFPLGIPECGADALRFTLASYSYKAQFANIDVDRIKANRNFCNKIWQAFRFTTDKLGDGFIPVKPQDRQNPASMSPTDAWILSRLSAVVETCDTSFRSYDLNVTTKALYTFWRKEFCDVYLEYSKRALSSAHKDITKQILFLCLDTGLKLLSPFMPYITEELYQRLYKGEEVQSVCLAQYPQSSHYPWQNPSIEAEMDIVRDMISHVLSTRNQFNLTKAKPTVYVDTSNDHVKSAIDHHRLTFEVLARTNAVKLTSDDSFDSNKCYCIDVNTTTNIYMQLRGEVDLESTRKMLEKQREKCDMNLNKLQDNMNRDSTFVENNQEKLKVLQSKLLRLDRALQFLHDS